MTRTWDIIDKILPGVEITQLNDRPVKFAAPGSGFNFGMSAVVILATASAFCMPIPRQGGIVSAVTVQSKSQAEPPPLLSGLGRESTNLTLDQENALLDKIEVARQNERSADTLRFDVLELNQEESLKKSPTLSHEQIVNIVRRRRSG
jgi:hypothetical protein